MEDLDQDRDILELDPEFQFESYCCSGFWGKHPKTGYNGKTSFDHEDDCPSCQLLAAKADIRELEGELSMYKDSSVTKRKKQLEQIRRRQNGR